MGRRSSSPQKKKRKYRRRYLRRVTSPVIMRNYMRLNPPEPPERSDSTFSYDLLEDDLTMTPQRVMSDDYVQIYKPIPMRPVYTNELPINPRTFTRPQRPLTYMERRYQEATDRVLRLQREEDEMIEREAFSLYPERGETAKLLRNRYMKAREREIRDEEEEEFRRSERRRRLIQENYRRKQEEESSRRMEESRRRTSPILRTDGPRSRPGLFSRLKGFISRKSPKKSSTRKGSPKKSSGRKGSPKKSSGRKGSPKKSSGRKGSPKKKPSKPEKPSEEKIKQATERSSSRRTSPITRSGPKKKRKARIVYIAEKGETDTKNKATIEKFIRKIDSARSPKAIKRLAEKLETLDIPEKNYKVLRGMLLEQERMINDETAGFKD